MPYGTVNADLMTTSDGVSSSGLYGFKNRIINGAMTFNQRGASNTSNGYSLDRYLITAVNGSKMTVQQSSDAPTGFSNSLLIVSPLRACVKHRGGELLDLFAGGRSPRAIPASYNPEP